MLSTCVLLSKYAVKSDCMIELWGMGDVVLTYIIPFSVRDVHLAVIELGFENWSGSTASDCMFCIDRQILRV